MKEKTIEIIAPEGYEVDKERSSLEKIVFRALPAKWLPKIYGELEIVAGYKVCGDSTIEAASGKSVSHNKGIFPTPEEAEASIALAQLCQLRDRYNGGWKVNFDEVSNKHSIIIYKEKAVPESNVSWHQRHSLCFYSAEIRDKFMSNFADLIEKAKPLLG